MHTCDRGIDFACVLRYFYWILELFRQYWILFVCLQAVKILTVLVFTPDTNTIQLPVSNRLVRNKDGLQIYMVIISQICLHPILQ